MKNILIVRQKYTAFGGAERFVGRVMDALVKQGVDVSVLTRKWSGESVYPVHQLKPFYLGRLWRDWSFASSVCGFVGKQQELLVQSHERLSCCDIYRAGDGVHREWLVQRARINNPVSNLFSHLSLYHHYVKWAESRMFHSQRLKKVVCNSPMVREEIVQRFQLDDSKLTIIRNGVNAEKFHPKLREQHRKTILQEYGIPQDAMVILILGSGFERKGVEIMLKAVGYSSDKVHLLVVGKTSSPKKFERQANKLGIKSRVTFAGPQSDPLPFYGAADVFALPAIYDPAPNVILEAMATGLPVITSFKTGNFDLVKEHQAGFVSDALDLAAIIEFIRRLQDEKTRQTMGVNARKAVLPWTEERMAEEYQALYQEVLN